MSLRVLLADESSTIKKVMQLALQDFNVEVKAVPVGLDVLEVTRAFQPDLIFADVLLSKRNGYEVSAELKADAELSSIPIILMWSGFMELDETKAQNSRADRRLEKPFDADTLRNMVRDLVPKTQTNIISQYLSFPNLPEIEERPPVTIPQPVAQQVAPPAPPQPPPPTQAVNKAQFPAYDSLPKIPQAPSAPPIPPAQQARPQPMAPPPPLPTPHSPSKPPPPAFEMDEPEDFQNVPLPKLPERAPGLAARQASEERSEPESWAQQDLAKFKISISEEDLLPDYDYGGKDLTRSSIAISSGIEDISIEDFAKSSAPLSVDLAANKALGNPGHPPPSGPPESLVQSAHNLGAVLPGTNLPSMTSISHERMEQILREQVREVLEGIAWKVLPDLAERIIKEEIQKLIKDSERI